MPSAEALRAEQRQRLFRQIGGLLIRG